MVRLMCAPPEENLRPNLSKAGEAAGKPMEEGPLAGAVLCIESRHQIIVSPRLLTWTLATPRGGG
jgi:hypothetical protein